MGGGRTEGAPIMASGSVLAIDLGTSGVKAAVVRPDGTLAATALRPVPLIELPDGGIEQDPDVVWHATVDAGREVVTAASADAPPVCAVAVASQYSSVVPVDVDGRPTMHMVMWADPRSDDETLSRLAGERIRVSVVDLLRWTRIHGAYPISGATTLSHMRWIRYARPDVYARTATFLEPADYLTLRLTGRTTATQCSTFAMLLVDNRDPDHGRWAPSLVARSRIDPDRLPPLVDVDAEVGPVRPDVAADLGIGDDVVVHPGVNDTQAGFVGSGAFRPDDASLDLGTTIVMATEVPFKKSDPFNSIVTMPSPVPGRNLVWAEGGAAGKAVEHFLERLVFGRDGFGDHTLEDKFAALHEAIGHVPPGSGGVLFLPWVTGALSPSEDGRVRGGFLNISLSTTREHLGRAVLEGVAHQVRWLGQAVERFSKRPVSVLRFFGGGALSPMWAGILADVTEREVHRLADPQYVVCRGAGFLGLVRTGQLALGDVPEHVPVAGVHVPDPVTRERYTMMYEQFVAAFRRNRKIFRALNR